MTTSTPVVSSLSIPLSSAGTAGSAPATTPTPHMQDTIETREPICGRSAGFCTSICSTVSYILRSIKTKIHQLINYFFSGLGGLDRSNLFTHNLNAIRDPNGSYEEKIRNFSNCFIIRNIELRSWLSNRNSMDECIKAAFTALPPELAEAIIHKTLQLSISPIAQEDRIVVSTHGRTDCTLSIRHLEEAVSFLRSLYPLPFFFKQLYIIQGNFGTDDIDGSVIENPTTPLEKIEALKALIDFNLNVTFDRFNLQSTRTEEEWKDMIHRTVELLPGDIKCRLFEKMWNLTQPRDGREAFLENPRSDQAKQAVAETLQTFANR